MSRKYSDVADDSGHAGSHRVDLERQRAVPVAGGGGRYRQFDLVRLYSERVVDAVERPLAVGPVERDANEFLRKVSLSFHPSTCYLVTLARPTFYLFHVLQFLSVLLFLEVWCTQPLCACPPCEVAQDGTSCCLLTGSQNR